jgi:transposase-like protein
MMTAPHPPEVRESAIELYQQGLTARAVADLKGLNEKTVQNWVTKAGVARPRGGSSSSNRVAAEAKAAALADLKLSGQPLERVAKRHKVSPSALRDWRSREREAALDVGWVRVGMTWRAAPRRGLSRVPASAGHVADEDVAA